MSRILLRAAAFAASSGPAGVIRMCRARTIDPSKISGLAANSFLSLSSVPCWAANFSHRSWLSTSTFSSGSVMSIFSSTLAKSCLDSAICFLKVSI